MDQSCTQGESKTKEWNKTITDQLGKETDRIKNRYKILIGS